MARPGPGSTACRPLVHSDVRNTASRPSHRLRWRAGP